MEADEHPRPTPLEALKALKPAFKGVQTGGNSSAIVDGAAAVVVAQRQRQWRQAAGPHRRRCDGGRAAGDHGDRPGAAIRAVLAKAGLKLEDIARFEINEAFGAQYIAVERELGLDRAKVNVNGGAIAIGHPLGATGVRCTLTVARELQALQRPLRHRHRLRRRRPGCRDTGGEHRCGLIAASRTPSRLGGRAAMPPRRMTPTASAVAPGDVSALREARHAGHARQEEAGRAC